LATFARVEAAVSQLPHARVHLDSIASLGSRFDTVEDGSFVVEIGVADSPLMVSC
jgi:hypothetical protein